jgi:hypothetical protein
MHIHEAVKKAIEQNKKIQRKAYEYFSVKPTDSGPLACLIFSRRDDKPGRYWNPSANDLMADDWELCD